MAATVQLLLAIDTRPVWPSASPYSVGTPKERSFAAVYPARTYPYRRFGPALTSTAARLGAGVGRYPFTV
jgi:hypothetical protein